MLGRCSDHAGKGGIVLHRSRIGLRVFDNERSLLVQPRNVGSGMKAWHCAVACGPAQGGAAQSSGSNRFTV
jgi:hypothetical protein